MRGCARASECCRRRWRTAVENDIRRANMANGDGCCRFACSRRLPLVCYFNGLKSSCYVLAQCTQIYAYTDTCIAIFLRHWFSTCLFVWEHTLVFYREAWQAKTEQQWFVCVCFFVVVLSSNVALRHDCVQQPSLTSFLVTSSSCRRCCWILIDENNIFCEWKV